MMNRVHKLKSNTISNDENICTKRAFIDNSETYIKSKLNVLYEKVMSDRYFLTSKLALKKMIENSYENK